MAVERIIDAHPLLKYMSWTRSVHAVEMIQWLLLEIGGGQRLASFPLSLSVCHIRSLHTAGLKIER